MAIEKDIVDGFSGEEKDDPLEESFSGEEVEGGALPDTQSPDTTDQTGEKEEKPPSLFPQADRFR